MAITQHQLDQFHQFATEQISGGQADLTWPQLFDEWRIQNPTAEEQAQIYAALDESLDDMRNGRHRPAGQLLSELRNQANRDRE